MSAQDVAKWMMDRVTEWGQLDQGTAAARIRVEFGAEYIYTNKNGNWAIDKNVLRIFNKLSGDNVVWERSYRTWRLRNESHKPGREQP